VATGGDWWLTRPKPGVLRGRTDWA
jgi:hypothetical protein